MTRLIAIFAALTLLLAGLLAWQGELELAAMFGSGAALTLFLLAAHRLPRGGRKHFHWVD